MPPGPLEIKEKSCLTDATPSDMPTCYIAAAATYMPVGLVLMSTTPLLFKHAYWLSAAARWRLAGLWPLNQHAC